MFLSTLLDECPSSVGQQRGLYRPHGMVGPSSQPRPLKDHLLFLSFPQCRHKGHTAAGMVHGAGLARHREAGAADVSPAIIVSLIHDRAEAPTLLLFQREERARASLPPTHHSPDGRQCCKGSRRVPARDSRAFLRGCTITSWSVRSRTQKSKGGVAAVLQGPFLV